jgi:predicted O-methyltransferase YrrM
VIRGAQTAQPSAAERERTGVPAAGLTAREFMTRFGASCRTKHLMLLPTGRRALAGFAWRLARGRETALDRRPYALPRRSSLPREFIRLDPWEASYLYMVAARATHGILEVGRFHGGSTFLLACANPHVPIWSIDLEPQDDGLLRSLLEEHGVGANVHLIVGDSQHGAHPEIGAYDLLFVDGDHSYEGCSADLRSHLPGLRPGGHVLLHDSYDGSPVQRAAIELSEQDGIETVRSPYVIASHWTTSFGSIAHFHTPPAPDSAPTLAPDPAVRRERARSAPAPAPPVARRRTSPIRGKLVAAGAVALFLFGLFGVVPELLGDWPYNPWGVDSRSAHVSHAPPG